MPLGPTEKAPSSALNAAADILADATARYRAWFEKGVALGETNAQVDWYVGYGATEQVKDMEDAFKKADANFTAANEPASIGTWLDPVGDIPGEIEKWYMTSRGKDQTLTAKILADFDRAAAITEDVRAGK